MFSQTVSLTLFVIVLWSGYKAGWFNMAWTWQIIATLALGMLIAWNGRNEFGGK